MSTNYDDFIKLAWGLNPTSIDILTMPINVKDVLKKSFYAKESLGLTDDDIDALTDEQIEADLSYRYIKDKSISQVINDIETDAYLMIRGQKRSAKFENVSLSKFKELAKLDYNYINSNMMNVYLQSCVIKTETGNVTYEQDDNEITPNFKIIDQEFSLSFGSSPMIFTFKDNFVLPSNIVNNNNDLCSKSYTFNFYCGYYSVDEIGNISSDFTNMPSDLKEQIAILVATKYDAENGQCNPWEDNARLQMEKYILKTNKYDYCSVV
jgi:hypothetical protein